MALIDDRVVGLDEDRRLVLKCLTGEESGWDELFKLHHPRLQKTIGYLLRPRNVDLWVIDEVAARVWFALVRNDAQLLARYDAGRHSRLESFLAGLARIEVLRYVRSESRRRSREGVDAAQTAGQELMAEGQFAAIFDDFVATLTPAEREFLECSLIAPVQEEDRTDLRPPLSPANIWQRRHRIRTKLRGYFRETKE